MGRKKKHTKVGYKWVAVDHKTFIEVPIDKPDEDAVRDHLQRRSESTPSYLSRARKPKKDGS
jgi:hypothetical protein